MTSTTPDSPLRPASGLRRPASALMHMLRTSRAVQAYLMVYVLAVAYLAWRGRWDSLVQQAMWIPAVALLLLAAWQATTGRSAASSPPVQGPARRRVLWQLVVLGIWLLIVWITWWKQVPWATAHDPILRLPGVGRLFSLPNVIGNPLQQFLIPAALLAMMGVPLRDMGLRRGGGRALAAASVLPLLALLVTLLTNAAAVVVILRMLLSNFLQNGPMEEMLWRGALQGRLERLVRLDVALVATALLFGFSHIPAWMRTVPLGEAMALSVVGQSLVGLLFGFFYQRTQSIVPGSAAHVLVNTVAQVL